MKLLESQIAELPQGKLICARNDNRWKWYCSDGHKSVYIPKKEQQFAEKLATKKYLSLLCEDMRQEKDAIDFYLRHHKIGKAEELLINESEYQKLLSSSFQSREKEKQDWINSQYEKCNKYPEKRIFKTASGNMVRSKSEVLIDMALYTNAIPFRYECELNLGEWTVYPDFTIKHPKTGKIYYWEHFGKMDDPKYNRNIGDRIQTYVNNGIIPSIDLIATYETLSQPLSIDDVENIVKEYFLL